MEKLKSKCEMTDCQREATALTFLEGPWNDDLNDGFSEREPKEFFSLCDEHLKQRIDQGAAEYVPTCPNCGCRFGVG